MDFVRSAITNRKVEILILATKSAARMGHLLPCNRMHLLCPEHG
jgi:hypothetical protein